LVGRGWEGANLLSEALQLTGLWRVSNEVRKEPYNQFKGPTSVGTKERIFPDFKEKLVSDHNVRRR
jgi:hypothetical protein